MKLFKKLMAALLVLMIAGMLASCGGGNSDSGGKGDWKIVYNGSTYIDDLTYADIQDGIEEMELVETTDYTIDQSAKTVTLTSSGYAKVEAYEEEYAQGGENGGVSGTGEWKMVYGGNTYANGLTWDAVQTGITSMSLVENTDYTINQSTKTVTLTDSGFAKLMGFDPEDMSEDDDENLLSTYYDIIYNGSPINIWPASDLDRFATEAGLILGTDYTRNDTDKEIILTETGYDKTMDYIYSYYS